MGQRLVYHVIPHRKAGWDIQLEGQEEPVDHAESKDQAIDKGKTLAKLAEEGDLVIHNRAGEIERELSYRSDVGQHGS